MAIEIYNGSSWQDVDDPEICTSAAGSGTFTNIQKGEIYTGSGWEVFYIRSVGNGGTAAAPVIALSDKSSRRIRITVQHNNSSGDNVIVLAYIDDVNPPVFLSPISTQIHPNTGYTTTTYSGQIETFGSNTYNSVLDEDATYYIASVAQFYNSSNGLIKSVAGNTLTVTTHPYFTAGKPVSLASYFGVALKTSTQLYLYAEGNAYNNGDAWLRWQYQSRNAGSGSAWTDLGTVDDSSNAFTDNQSNDNRGRYFTSLDNDKEYRFRARVVYSGLGNSNSEVGAWGSYSNFIRPLYSKPEVIGTFAAMNDTTYFREIGTGTDKSEISASSNYDSNTTPAKASDGNSGTVWLSNPSVELPFSTTVTSIKRDGSYVYYSGSGLTSVKSVTNVTVSNINRLRGNILTTKRENAGGSTYYVNIKGGGSTIYPFNASDNSVTIAGLSDSVTNGTKDLNKRIADNELRYISFVSAFDSAYKSDTGTITSATSGGSAVSNLNIKDKGGAMDVVGGSTVKIATADVGTTLQFSLTEVLGDGTNTPTMGLTGLVDKDYGTETLNAYFNVKSDYSYAKIEANDNFVSVTNGDLATTIKVYLNNTQINVGDESFGINQTRNFAPSTTMYATYASEFKDTAFYVKLEVARVDTGFGWYAKVQEVKLKFRYFTLNYDDGVT
jgi:hypothetical protein